MALTLGNITPLSSLQLQTPKVPVTNREKAVLGYIEDNLLDFTQIAMALTLGNITLLSLLQLQTPKVPITNREKAALGYPEDNLLDFTQIAVKYGYNSSGYSVTTEDGYILKLYNIVNPRCKTYVEPPVLLMHGLLFSSDIWLDAGPNASLAYLLADQCYDLWVGNVRGNYLGREHVNLKPDSDPKFWDFSFDDMGMYDAPAIIGYVLNETGSKQLNYIGFSQGGGMFAVMGSERPEYVKKVRSFVGLAPATRLTNTKSIVFRSVSELCVALSELGVVELFFKGSVIQEALELYCQKESSYVLCSSVLGLIDSAHPGSLKKRTLKRLFAHAPAGTSVKNFVRYAQGFHSDKFQKFDYGKEENLKRYGNETAPEYDLSGITIPALLIAGLNDHIVDMKDVTWLQEQLPNAILKTVDDPLWNHVDDSYDFDDTSSNDSKEKETPVVIPPEDIQVVIDKMAAYVARNGDEFAEIVQAKNDPRFTFLEPNNEYHPWYLKLMRQKRGVENGGKDKNKKDKKSIAPVSFSIKKLKEPDPVLPKPALPYESSSEDESETKQTEAETAQTQETTPTTSVQTKVPQVLTTPNIPPAIVYKIDAQTNPVNNVTEKPQSKAFPEKVEAKVEVTKTAASVEKKDVIQEKPSVVPKVDKIEQVRKERSITPEKKKARDDIRKEKKYKEEEHRSKSESKDYKRDRNSVDKDKKRYKESDRVKKRRKCSKDEFEGEIISLEDNSEELIDLTGDLSETKADGDSEAEKAKQMERRRRAAEFLKKVGVDPAAAALPTSSLASAMVDTLESLRKKKVQEEEKRRKREKRRRREYNGDRDKRSKRRRHDNDDDTDHESSKKKKRKKDKKHSSSKSKKKKRRAVAEEQEIEEIVDQPLSIDLKGTLKELRTSSPTKDLCFQGMEETTRQSESSKTNTSESEDVEKGETKVKKREKKKRKKKKKEERQYSEGEWSSDSEGDSHSTGDSN